MVDWFGNISGAPGLTAAVTKGARSLSILVSWTVWKERNARIFQGAENAPALMVETIKSEARLWTKAGNKNLARIVGAVSRVIAYVFHRSSPCS
jgi:hypothetical protein